LVDAQPVASAVATASTTARLLMRFISCFLSVGFVEGRMVADWSRPGNPVAALGRAG
jgi:hypothetical protein